MDSKQKQHPQFQPATCGRLACRVGICVFLKFAASAGSSTAQTVTGSVIDSRTALPIDSAYIIVKNMKGVIVDSLPSDSSGRFRSLLPFADRYTIHGGRLGYVSSTDTIVVRQSEAVEITIRLHPIIGLDSLVVQGQRRGTADYRGWLGVFYDRRRFFGPLGGKFFHGDDLQIDGAPSVSDLIVSLVPRARLVHGREGPLLALERFGSVCEPVFYRNGARIVKRSGERIETYIDLSELLAVEVYSGVTIPPELMPASCGAVVFWTQLGTGRR